jgi:putative Mn2+ efflux pump MntP
MGIIEIIALSIGLAMDATAVSMTNGMNDTQIKFKKMILIGLTFGLFQALMPLIGYLFGTIFVEFIEQIDHWIALVLLGFLGFQMLREGFSKDEEEGKTNELGVKMLLMQGIATSIDALAVGVSFASLKVNITYAVLSIGIITTILSILGVFIGKKFRDLLKNKASILGGIILISIGLKIFIEHMFF